MRKAIVLIGGLLFWTSGPASAQDPPPPDSAGTAAAVQVADSLAADSATGISPAGAFLRGALIPGWGHTTTGSMTRGAFYFSVEALAGWMVYKTQRRLGVARDQAAVWEELATAELAAMGVTEPDQVEAALEQHDQVARFRGLVDAREEQREDWVAVALFTLLLSGVDAFVSAHLSEFPEPLTIEGDPSGGTVELAVRIPVG
ncbi:MAG: DUF5683 domain-containing protein [Gemmatimonadota bacterium]|nr:DUF5683 domain-containing protein [Gemmatimonadota bacterium]MDE2864701.1 DUF5683 domain-containing protein [Gemmatimonadota bacterium]MYB05507.1 hypothetical protein [Gemmatimonadota bacterium]MYE15803.1 hypothetical protein [Gemmatimonadota bacterium]MYG23757.1 hypothetical protein [Gemmatimonadota bacterium]